MKTKGKVKNTIKDDYASGKLLIDIYTANHFDQTALEINRSGRLSGRQYLNAFQVFGLVLLMIGGVVYLFRRIPLGGSYINSGQFQQAFLPCGGSIVVFILVLLLYALGGRIGLERYLAKTPQDLLRKMLVVVDIFLGQVEAFEGMVSRGTEIETTYIKKEGGFREPQKTTRYFYKSDGEAFRVSEEGYAAFPSKPRMCRLYYLPTSKVIVNLEFIY